MRGRRLRDGMKAGLIEFPLVRMPAWPIAIASIHFSLGVSTWRERVFSSNCVRGLLLSVGDFGRSSDSSPPRCASSGSLTGERLPLTMIRARPHP
jgi:hypothetical protein